jgi:hypothetical protein
VTIREVPDPLPLAEVLGELEKVAALRHQVGQLPVSRVSLHVLVTVLVDEPVAKILATIEAAGWRGQVIGSASGTEHSEPSITVDCSVKSS